MAKQITIKSFNSAGTYIGNIIDATFESFSKTLNGGLSELIIKLARTIDNFNPNSDVSIGNKIEIWVNDEDTDSEGIKIYSGFIEQQNPIVDGDDHYVEIICYGVVSKLKNDYLKEVAQTTLYSIATTGLTTALISQAAAEIADILKAIIDKYNAVQTAFNIFYNLSGVETIEDSGNNMQYTFEALTYFEAIEKCRAAAPENWYWYLDAEDRIYFKAPSSSADHDFTLGKNIKSIKISKTADAIKNVILIWDGQAGGTYNHYENSASITTYGRRVEKKVDANIKDSATMDNIGNSFLNENKDPKVRMELEIADNNENALGYDIESIEPGDTCRIVGLDVDGIVLGENMIIKEVIYQLTSVRLIIDMEKTYDMQQNILKIESELAEQRSEGIPESYT